MPALLESPLFQALDGDGTPVAGGLLYTYLPGTSTPTPVFHDAGLTTAWANPVPLDAAGQALIYFGAPIKLTVTDANAVALFTVDPVLPHSTDPAMLEDYSTTVAQMRAQTDPGEVGSESLPTSLAGELERLRFALAEAKGTQYWYETPPGEAHAGQYASLNAAVAALGASPTVLHIDRVLPVVAPVTVPATLALVFGRGGALGLAGFTVTLAGHEPLVAGRHIIFTGLGSVLLPGAPTVFPEWWGADGSGLADSAAAFNATIAALPNGGTLLGAGRGATYLVVDVLAPITTHNLTLDFAYATLISPNSRGFGCNGDSGVDGDRSQCVTNVVYKNAFLGTTNDSANRFYPGNWLWCEHLTIENLVVRGHQEGLQVSYCHGLTVRNLWMYGVSDGAIGVLSHMSDDVLIDNVHFRDMGARYAVQVKGGSRIVVHACSAVRQVNPGGFVTPLEVAFRDRGDAPWGASPTGGTYPFTTGSWAAPDERRASHDVHFVDCFVEDSPEVFAFEATEAIGTHFIRPRWRDVKVGINISRVSGGAEKDFFIDAPLGDETGTTGGYGVAASGIVCDGVSGNLLPGLHIQGGKIRNTDGRGVFLDYCADPILEGVTVYNSGLGTAGGVSQYGIHCTNSLRPSLLGCRAHDDQGTPTQTFGIFIDTTCTYPRLVNCLARRNSTEQIRSWLLGHYANNDPGEATVTTTDGTINSSRLRVRLYPEDVAWVEVLAVARQGTTHRAVYRAAGLVYADAATLAQIQGSPQTGFGHAASLAQLTDNSGGTANNTIAAITTGGAAADQAPTRDAIADLAAKVNALVNPQNGIESNSAWPGLTLSDFGTSDTFRASITGLAATTIEWVLTLRCTLLRTA